MSTTISEAVRELHDSLSEYIEATYHIGHPVLVRQRRRLLARAGVISQVPYIESTPRYTTDRKYSEIGGLDPAAVSLFTELSSASNGLRAQLFNPPYRHQARALEEVLTKERSAILTTGTGSGKTESFLLPAIGKLATEAANRPESFATSAVRVILLYPMNALVNDQLGRLRLIMGDPRLVGRFKGWAGRPARFARYTSRTLYPGVRTAKKDQERLRAIGDYYVRLLEEADDPGRPEIQTRAQKLIEELSRRGKWPAKPDLRTWYGARGSRWQSADGVFQRCVTLPDDPELLTRHEVHAAAPDVLVTNYSMLEYMLMRPLERPIFDQTRAWLEANPTERLLLIIDEAHLYRGAAGAEVSLLIRRLRARLGIAPERLQVICTSASFDSVKRAVTFAAQLAGKDKESFSGIAGELKLRDPAGPGSEDDARALASVDLDAFYAAGGAADKLARLEALLAHRATTPVGASVEANLFEALRAFPPLGLAVNITMQRACPVSELAADVFPGVDADLAERALTVLLALGSVARPEPDHPGLVPCRVHSFYRGLPGLWACMDPNCGDLEEAERGGPTGRLYSQPRDLCGCGSRVFELYTCRSCGTAYARAYTDDLDQPDYLWSEPGRGMRAQEGDAAPLFPLDLLLEPPALPVRAVELDLVGGRIDPVTPGERARSVFLAPDTDDDSDEDGDAHSSTGRGAFRPCGVCGEMESFGRSSVQDHLTKGDQPFLALISQQLLIQPPNQEASKFAPLGGRKVLVFSDSRQTAARLAPSLQNDSMRDVLRPLLVAGVRHVDETLAAAPARLAAAYSTLDALYSAVLVGVGVLGGRIRPELKSGESVDLAPVETARREGVLDEPMEFLAVMSELQAQMPPQSLLRGVNKIVWDRYTGLEALALASVEETPKHTDAIAALPDLPGVTSSPEERLAVARAWIRHWGPKHVWLQRMPATWDNTEVHARGTTIRRFERHVLRTAESKRVFRRDWVPVLLERLCTQVTTTKYRMRGSELRLRLGGDWAYCSRCRSVQRPFPSGDCCLNCGSASAHVIDPATDAVFTARKGYYRRAAVRALEDPSTPPFSIVAAEHTAQLNSANEQNVFSKAEENELRFQDVELGAVGAPGSESAVDVLSCTTTMEVGIDIGALSGVALRNMPPARSNYQQRAGRAGRRGNAIATVIAFGSADSHDEHYFQNPDLMIRGRVDDPFLTLDNYEIARRHVTAYLLQTYHQERLPDVKPTEKTANLFAVLGTVAAFKRRGSEINRFDFEEWLRENEPRLKAAVEDWLPVELGNERFRLSAALVPETLDALDRALAVPRPQDFGGGDEEAVENEIAMLAESMGAGDGAEREADEEEAPELPPEPEDSLPADDPGQDKLLNRLLYKGILPRYAFPTDVAALHIFDTVESTTYKPRFQFAPSQALSVALSQYAPGKEVWVAGRKFISGAIYSPVPEERWLAWQNRRIYYECSVCHNAITRTRSEGRVSETLKCDACGSPDSLGPSRRWLRPPGFAHPVDVDEATSPDEMPAKSYATRAKLLAPTPPPESAWLAHGDRVRVHHLKDHLLVTNRGPQLKGYNYCLRCGRIEPSAVENSTVAAPHPKPYPDRREQTCPGGRAVREIVLGTDFITDVLLVSLRVQAPLTLRADLYATEVALRTVSEALAKAAAHVLQLEPAELQAEFRPALTLDGREGIEAEIFLYDTLAGGAGFARQAGVRFSEIFAAALHLLETCPDGCDRSCYRCLRSYKNKFDHDLLDRRVGAYLLRYLQSGEVPRPDPAWVAETTDRLCDDLRRQLDGEAVVQRSAVIPVGSTQCLAPILATSQDGSRLVIGVLDPLTASYSSDPDFQALLSGRAGFDVWPVEEVLARRNLPWVSSQILQRLTD
jgi:ATP-dependent helicase YprA (DUF1998 family)